MTRTIPWLCAVLHLLALAAIGLLLQPGLELEPDLARRAEYITGNLGAWRAGWVLWMLSAASLVAYYAWWAAHIPPSPWRMLGVVLAAAGMACDLAGEGIFITAVVEHARRGDLAAMADAQRMGSVITATGANSLYTIGGVTRSCFL